jgi:hypothetical protein
LGKSARLFDFFLSLLLFGETPLAGGVLFTLIGMAGTFLLDRNEKKLELDTRWITVQNEKAQHCHWDQWLSPSI